MSHVTAAKAAQALMITTLIASCKSEDRRLAEFAQRTTEQQARQSERMAQQSEALLNQSQQVTAAAQELVQQDAAARRDVLQAHERFEQQAHGERVHLDRQREQLDTERKAAAQAAVRDPVVAQAIITTGLTIAALLPLLVTLFALWRLPEQRPMDGVLEDRLLETMASCEPALRCDDAPSRRLSTTSTE